MKRRRVGNSKPLAVYHQELLPAIKEFLPSRGLPLQSADSRYRWTDRLLAIMGVLMSWRSEPLLTDGFEACWQTLTDLYPTRRRAGHSYEGFRKALLRRSGDLLEMMQSALRRAMPAVAGGYWRIDGWLVMGVDGSRVNCPRTAANEAAFHCAGKPGTAPQQFVTTLLHVGTGLIWAWRRGGGKEAERHHLRQMLPTLPEGALLLADAGFTGYELLRALIAAGHPFVIRAGGNVRLLKKLGFTVREYADVVYLWPQDRRDEEPLVLRLVVLHDGRKAVHLLTSVLEASVLTDRQVGRMYRRRWGLEVFYRSLKQTMQKHTLRSRTPKGAAMELDWALVGLWLLGMMAVKRLVARGVAASQWSVAVALRLVRRVMAGRGSLQAARGLRGLGGARKDAYVRHGPKDSRPRPQKKKESPPKPPLVRTASDEERAMTKRFTAQNPAA